MTLRTLIVVLYALSLMLFIEACATVRPPSGGPEDKTSPRIDADSSIPKTNFKASSINIHFSEYVEKNKVNESIIITPEKALEFHWSSKDLEIRFAEALDSGTTYALTLGTDYTDLHGNKPLSAYTVVFSTGSQLDSGSIHGEVVDANPAGIFVFLYPLRGLNPDTLDPTHTKPRYRTQLGSDGSFRFSALPYGTYRVFAIRDLGRDGVFTVGVDAFGTTSGPVELRSAKTSFVSMRLEAASDLVAPQLVDLRVPSQQRLELLCSESMDTSTVHASDFTISDSLGRQSATVLSAFVSPSSSRNISLLISPLQTVASWTLKVRADKTSLTDLARNPFADSASSISFRSLAEKDSSGAFLVSSPLRDSASAIALAPEFMFVLSTAVQRDDVEQHLAIIQKNVRVESKIEWPADNIIVIRPRDTLQSDAWYELRFRLSGLQVLSGSGFADTTLRLRFKTLDTRNCGSIKAEIIDSNATSTNMNYVVNLYSKSVLFRRQKLTKPGICLFNNLPEGEYSLDAYCDSDQNGRYSAGQALPYKPAERFAQRIVSLGVKARWTVEDARIVFPRRDE